MCVCFFLVLTLVFCCKGFEPGQGTLAAAVNKLRVKDMMVPGAELVVLDVHSTVGEVESLLRELHCHSVPIWNAPQKQWEGVIDTTDLVTWASVKFPKAQLDAWTTLRQEDEFVKQRVHDILNISGRNRLFTTTPETGALDLLGSFRDLDVHRIFVKREEKQLIGVVTHTDVIRFLKASPNFEAKGWRIGDKIPAGRVLTCYEEELCVSAFKIMWRAGINVLPVTNAKGQVVAALSSYDVVQKTESIVSTLYKTIKAYQGRDVPNAPVNLVTVKPSTTFGEALDLMAANKITHLFVVDDDGYPTAVLTVRDILRAFLPKD